LADTKRVAYEGMFIFDANRLARDPQGLPDAVAEMITAAGGELEVSRLWEERRLAYPIKGHRKGAYWITYFHLPPSQVSPLTKQCEIKDGILRQLFVKLPESLVEPIIAHAKGDTTDYRRARGIGVACERNFVGRSQIDRDQIDRNQERSLC